jgi:hypothetical protein
MAGEPSISTLTHGTNTITEDIRSIWFAVIRRQIQQIYHHRRQPIESSYRSTERLEKNKKISNRDGTN